MRSMWRAQCVEERTRLRRRRRRPQGR